MNPENSGNHIALRHSYLWRDNIFAQKNPSRLSLNHSDNQSSGLSRNGSHIVNSHTRTLSIGSKDYQKPINRQRRLKKQPPEENRSSSSKKELQMMKKQLKNMQKSDQVLLGLLKLKQLNLLGNQKLNHVRLPGTIKVQHVYNDYHIQKANPGFSRNHQGKFFTT